MPRQPFGPKEFWVRPIDGSFGPSCSRSDTCFWDGMSDYLKMVAGIEPPPDLEPLAGNSIHTRGSGQILERRVGPGVCAGPGNLDLYKRIAGGEGCRRSPRGGNDPSGQPKEPDPILETLQEIIGGRRRC